MSVSPGDPLVLLLAAIGTLSPVIAVLFKMLIAEKDARIADLRQQVDGETALREVVGEMRGMGARHERTLDEVTGLVRLIRDRGYRGLAE